MLGWYCASKHALEALSDALRIEVADYGVRVILIEPGVFGTGIWAGARYPEEPRTPEYAAAYQRSRGATTRGTALMPDPKWVARTVRLALASPMPLARYLVGVDAFGGVVAETLAPTLVADWFKGMASGMRRLPLPATVRAILGD